MEVLNLDWANIKNRCKLGVMQLKGHTVPTKETLESVLGQDNFQGGVVDTQGSNCHYTVHVKENVTQSLML